MKTTPARLLFVAFCLLLAVAWYRLTRPPAEYNPWAVDLHRLLMDADALSNAVNGRTTGGAQ